MTLTDVRDFKFISKFVSFFLVSYMLMPALNGIVPDLGTVPNFLS
jgi:hypothetical protein